MANEIIKEKRNRMKGEGEKTNMRSRNRAVVGLVKR
jgi:hypothetical protein